MIADYSPHGGPFSATAWTFTPLLPAVAPLDPQSRQAHELLESLDDAMFAAIAGQATAVAEAQALWRRAVAVLPSELVEESREQYLRFAAEVTRRVEEDGLRDATIAIAAFEIIALLAQ
jgi:hypothetical protein